MITRHGRISINTALIMMFMGLYLFSGKAFAAGGPCPSGANYTNPSDPTGPMVTLASLGITNCYYVSAAGSDSYAGTSEAAPWLHSPGMQNCSGNCLTVKSSMFGGAAGAGRGFIFRGGDTWHFGNSSASPYAGVVAGCAANFTASGGLCLDDVFGTSSNPIYYGVDKNWNSGSSWARPIISADNSFCGPGTTGTMPDGATCTGTTDGYGQPSYYVSSCPYQVGGSNNLVDVGWSSYIILDDLELSGLCQSHVGEPGSEDMDIIYNAAQGPLTFENLYIHGSSHLRYAGKVASAQCTSSTVCQSMSAFDGSVGNGSVGETIVYNVVDFSDSDPGGSGLGGQGIGMYNTAYNVFRYVVSNLPNHLHLFHDNLYKYFFEDGHSNVMESIDLSGTNAFYNNVFRHIETYVTSGGGVFLWFGPASGATDYIFNNIGYDVGPLEYLNNGGVALTTVAGNYVWFNNTWQSNANQPILRCTDYTNGSVIDTNNLYIDNQNYILGPCPTLTTTTSLLLSNSTATSDGYTASEAYAYAPTLSTAPTVGAGTNEDSANGAFCSELARAGLSDAASACLSDTRYACSYNASNHTVSCPARTVVARSASAAWDIGAYLSASGGTPQPPGAIQAAGH